MNPAANPPHYPFQDEPFEVHPYAEIFTMMPDEDIDELANDIEQNSQLNPVQIYDGKILDGRNRYVALERLNHRRLVQGKPPIALIYGTFAKKVTPDNDAKALSFVRSHNLMRRNMHLTTSQRAALAAEFERHYADLAKRKEALRKSKEGDAIIVKSQESPLERTSAYKAGKDFNAGQQTVSRAKAVMEANPELHKAVKEGKTTVNKAYQQIKPKTKKEPEFVPLEYDTDPDPQTVESSSEEIISSFVSNIENLFPDELQYCLSEVYNRRREAILEFVAKLKITDPQLFA